MASGLRPFSETIFLTVLFSVFILLFSIQFLGEMNPNSEVITNDAYGLNNTATALNNELTAFTSLADSVTAQLSSSEPSPINYVFLIFAAAFYIPYTFLSFIAVAIGTLIHSIVVLGGGGLGGILALVATIVSSILLIRLVFFIVKSIRTGDSER